MKKEFFDEIKKSLPFKKFDIIIYSIISVVIVAIFLSIYLFCNKNENIGFKVIVDDNLVLTYIYDENISIESAYSNFVTVNKDDKYIIINIFTDNDKEEFNTLKVDIIEKSVCVIDANCSLSKDCTKFSPIKDESGTIICLPHSLYVIPLSGGYVSPTIGG